MNNQNTILEIQDLSELIESSTQQGSQAFAAASIRVARENSLFNIALRSTFTPVSMHSVTNDVMGICKQNEAWMLRKTIIIGPRKKFP